MIDPSAQLPADLELPAFTVVDAEVRIELGCRLGPFCHLHRGARLGAGVELGSHVVIGEGAILEDGVRLGSHTVVHPRTRVGSGSLVGDHAILGKLPTTASTSTLKPTGELPPLKMGPGCTVGALAVIYAGTILAEEVFVADLASIRERCRLERRVIVGRGATVENDVTIGESTKLQAEVYITALSTLEAHIFVAPAVVTTNDNYLARTEERFQHRKGCVLRSGCRIGGGAVLLPGVEIGEEAVVGAGSVVTRAVPTMKVAYGTPARVVRPTPPEQLLSAQKKS
ncbi:MAG: DapH/DapD/GlmU-related protein [Candidatus Xenobium sp.]|nr:transferase [Burkholderiales bacterium]